MVCTLFRFEELSPKQKKDALHLLKVKGINEAEKDRAIFTLEYRNGKFTVISVDLGILPKK